MKTQELTRAEELLREAGNQPPNVYTNYEYYKMQLQALGLPSGEYELYLRKLTQVLGV